VPATYDVIVAGLGAMGSFALRALARRGRRVVGLDRFAPPHAMGSSHGGSRIIREAYFEHPAYVPLVRAAYELWEELEDETGRQLLEETGGLMVGPPDGVVVAGSLASARQHHVAHQVLDAAEIRRRFPFAPDDGMIGLLEERAGVLFPESCIDAALERARADGAEIHTNEPVQAWFPDGAGVAVQTSQGTYRADRLVISAGAWLTTLVPDLPLPLVVERQLMHWFEPIGDQQRLAACPIALFEYAPDQLIYTFPDRGEGVKVGIHHAGELTHPDHIRRDVTPDDEAAVRALLARFVPSAAGRQKNARVCLYTNTPDGHFLLDRHPAHPQVLIVSPCSGHGFKFASVIGEIVADLATDGATTFDLRPFRLR
jgi:sarcosine oxidase